jgi:glycerol-3-phosphate dehydrogenase (NAD(P)+)
MTARDFWRKSTVAVIGGGAWGTVLAQLASKNCENVRVWARDEETVRAINVTRSNPDYAPGLELSAKVHAFSTPDRVFETGVHAVVWALPSSVCRAQAKELAGFFKGDEVILHATKGIEDGTMKRVSEILLEELPCPRVGVISGPNLAAEIARGEPAATVVASSFEEVIEAGQVLFATEKFRVYSSSDVIGVEWAGTLKNVLAIAAGALDAMNLGWNARSMMITRGLAEMVRYGVAMGADPATFLGLAGIGDLLATCSSNLSRNYRVGMRLAGGEKLDAILEDLGSTAEGVRTTRSVVSHARARGISMPITEGVDALLEGQVTVKEVLKSLMTRPSMPDRAY